MDIMLNRVAIWRPINSKGLNVRKSPPQTAYLTKDSGVYQSASNGLYRYAKNYTVKGVSFSLFVRTGLNLESKYVEAQLDTISKKITKEYALKCVAHSDMTNFEYTPYYLNEEE